MFAIILRHVDSHYIFGNLFFEWDVVGFFFIAGYTFKSAQKFKDFVIKKIRTLIVPVLCFGIINSLLSLGFKEFSLGERILGILLQVPGKYDDMWFVACLFVMLLIFYIVDRVTKSCLERLIACGAISALGLIVRHYYGAPLPWHLINACTMILFVGAGNLVKEYRICDYIKSLLEKMGFVKIAIIVICFCIISFIADNEVIDIHLLCYGSTWKMYFLGLLGALTVMSVSIFLERYKYNIICRFTQFIGKNSLCYYGVQSKFVTSILLLGSILKININNITVAPMYTVAILLLIAPLVIFINIYMPFILGKTYKEL